MLLAGASVVELQLRIRSQVLLSGEGGGEVMKGDTLEINCSHELFLN